MAMEFRRANRFGGRRVGWFLAGMVLALATAVGTTGTAAGGGKGHGHGSSHGGSADAKKKMIQDLEAQVAEAKQVLAQAQSKQGLTSKQIEEARKKLDGAEQEIASIHSELHELETSLAALDEEILGKLPDDSDYKKAKVQADKTAAALDKHLHRVLSLPPDEPDENGKVHHPPLSDEARQKLKDDFDYQDALKDNKKAKSTLYEAKMAVLKGNSEWVALEKQVQEARKKATEARTEARQAATTVTGGHKARKTGDIIAQAQKVILDGEAQLRALGVDPSKLDKKGKKK
jgi:DNA repair exonuclease SbcCD ATPase subunit